MPPTRRSRSSTVTGTPKRPSSTAAVRPAGPPPMMTARLRPGCLSMSKQLPEHALGPINPDDLVRHHPAGDLIDEIAGGTGGNGHLPRMEGHVATLDALGGQGP